MGSPPHRKTAPVTPPAVESPELLPILGSGLAPSPRAANTIPAPLVAVAAFLLPPLVAAQSALGSICGSVRDPLGGAVPAA